MFRAKRRRYKKKVTFVVVPCNLWGTIAVPKLYPESNPYDFDQSFNPRLGSRSPVWRCGHCQRFTSSAASACSRAQAGSQFAASASSARSRTQAVSKFAASASSAGSRAQAGSKFAASASSAGSRTQAGSQFAAFASSARSRTQAASKFAASAAAARGRTQAASKLTVHLANLAGLRQSRASRQWSSTLEARFLPPGCISSGSHEVFVADTLSSLLPRGEQTGG